MLKFFISIKTYLWLTGISIGAFLLGSIYIPGNLAVFSEINDIPLFTWMSENHDDVSKYLWIYLLIGLMLLLWISTLICSIEAIIKRTARRNLVRVLSPQVLHIAILFVLLGYFVSASTGYKEDVPMKMGETQEVKGFELQIDNMEFFKNPGEDSTRWRVYLKINSDMNILEVGKPSFSKGVGFFVKSADQKRSKAIIGLIYDPGVFWELIGAVVFIIGAFGLFYVRFNEQVNYKV
jgi:hypothetical protein